MVSGFPVKIHNIKNYLVQYIFLLLNFHIPIESQFSKKKSLLQFDQIIKQMQKWFDIFDEIVSPICTNCLYLG